MLLQEGGFYIVLYDQAFSSSTASTQHTLDTLLNGHYLNGTINFDD